ncbi:hypothetical protein HPB52_020429 [Rhipicephalus sanguineus]|uniref:Acyltransferase 3 domain-containing protein n=1 Tax=Rhipicephalus sanguineus TaxID=34632 RepID=A0A9D4TBL4_RHISA|nr:hypothetical protein HPB52_020429 [Rhipicephalus sanguineus]
MFQLSYFDRYDSTLAAVGFMAVDTFFFLSGYVLSYSISGVKNARGMKAAAVIAIRRWYRLVLPLVFVAACLSLLPLFVTGPTTGLVYEKFYDDVRSYCAYLNMLTDVYMLPFYHAACYFGGCITFYAVQKYKNKKLSKKRCNPRIEASSDEFETR